MNLFGSIEDMKIYIYCFFLWFYSSWNKRKKNERKKKHKKKRVQWRLEWATAHFLFVFSHNTAGCIVTQDAQQACMARKDTATIWPTGGTIRPACA